MADTAIALLGEGRHYSCVVVGARSETMALLGVRDSVMSRCEVFIP